MERQLREHFQGAIGDDPGVGSGDMVRAAIVEGAGLRRRRNRLTGAAVAAGMVVVVGVTAGLNLFAGPAVDQPVTLAAAMMPVVAASCTLQPVERDATDAVIFLDQEIADQQRAALEALLLADPRVKDMAFESRRQAYERFRIRWAHEPDFVAAVSVGQLPESFRFRLVQVSEYTAVRLRYAAVDGVAEVIGRRCPADAPVGGIQ
ncbi:permease-like cell division protein FtsX [Actinoplanes derwentensis]|uniref:FtsX extracellular domain-containing protein n=1 Tax=Actinoplanes derwentensis TaxID=113562 RepID=A0A1H1TNS8_9ACTN|nr:permease-like cell division protein FtsX [Actinoplanes derwentensis]GID85093.1 hypothetical protein Ade03nite_40170 [Actinoplanes derwentensis]SDS61985.1 hypothetical protein SAMN04489716_1198 [Actinoplanes derwentensis]